MSWTLSVSLVCLCAVVRTQIIPGKSRTNDGDYNTVNTDGSFDFGYTNKDRGSSYHLAHGNPNGLVGGRFGSKDPATDTVKETIYTAGPRGFRAKGPNIHRQLDLDQRPRGPIGNKDDPYFDPNEDPSYSFKFDTRTYSKNENADSRGDVTGFYTFVDDIGERHDVAYIAGRDTGFHVSSAHPDNPGGIGSPFHRAPLVRGETRPRGRTAVQRGLDGSYRFISAGPDQRRTESSDSRGNVRGSYTFLDDKGVQRTVNYIAGPGIGYRIIKNNKDAIPPYFPTLPSPYDPSFTSSSGGVGFSAPGPPPPPDTSADDVFKGPDGTAASGHVKPPPFQPSEPDTSNQPPPPPPPSENVSPPDISPPEAGSNDVSYNQPTFTQGSGDEVAYVDEDAIFGGAKPTDGPGRPTNPTSKPYRPQKTPYVPLKPFQTVKDDDDEHSAGDDKNTPQLAVGINLHGTKPGTTIIRNTGKDYFGVPPGVSVRAHVQSIDLYRYDSELISPSEAIEKEKT
ncbi:hypothetical protein K1T71_004314 [Dendrolimus kikuchii]|uniref:Uncharacterized protein n=1 Tax=Dendrolimus kikuchii TaxID=765133 RepID=A0ACC1D731_9NEOP|nr:hypothetical protein K1T71_004314 [Dendrolimus kikuchii]